MAAFAPGQLQQRISDLLRELEPDDAASDPAWVPAHPAPRLPARRPTPAAGRRPRTRAAAPAGVTP
jgi:hypothetical protein